VGDEVHLWQVGAGEQLSEIQRARLDLESRLEEWLKRDISVLDPALLVIGNQVETEGGPIDILCLDAAGDLVIVELKRDKTPRLITAQVLDYASCVAGFSHDDVTSVAKRYLGRDLEDAFRESLGGDLPETLNATHRILVVGSEIDASSERIIRYLSDEHGVNINAATFQYFRQPDGTELLARVFLIEPSEVERSVRAKGASKRRANLTREELQAQADEAGVRDLYDYVVAAFEPLLQTRTTQSSIGFAGLLDGSRKIILSLLPGESNTEEGLFYRLYKHRYAHLAALSDADIVPLMPRRHEDWTYWPGGDPDWEGFEGFIASRGEVDRLAGALRQGASAAQS
jgi:Endonuclease NucS